MNGNLVRISVIVCAYTEERWNEMLTAVESLRQQSLPPAEIILSIDHNPILFERARQEFPDLIVIENHEARGLSGARNSGLSVAKGDVVAFMDEDAFAEPSWLEMLYHHFNDRHVIGVGGAIIPVWSIRRPDWFPAEFNWVVGCTYLGMPESAAPIRNLIGCNMAFRREVFTRVGGFRDGIGRVGTFPAGCEETELCIRANQQMPGSRMIYEPLARVHHRVPGSRGQLRYFRNRCYMEGRSKALISRLIGTKDGLASERSYTQKTLPLGVLRGIADLFKGDFCGLLRAGAIVFGLFVTASGYLTGWLTLHQQQPQVFVMDEAVRDKI